MSRFSKVDKIAVGELQVNMLGPTHTMVVKAKLVSSKTGASYGSMTVQHWPPEVLQKLEELKRAAEEHLESLFFDEGTQGASGGSSPREVGGLGEHLEGDELAPPA